MHLRKVLAFITVLMTGPIFSGPALAADQLFCIDPGHTATSLLSALQSWNGSTGGTTTIKVVAGTFPISASLTQLNTPAGGLFLLGGYKPNTGCDEGQRNIKTNTTVLDGGGSSGYFYLEP